MKNLISIALLALSTFSLNATGTFRIEIVDDHRFGPLIYVSGGTSGTWYQIESAPTLNGPWSDLYGVRTIEDYSNPLFGMILVSKDKFYRAREY